MRKTAFIILFAVLMFSTKAQNLSLTIGEAFNWQVGDTLIYRPFGYHTYWPPNAPQWATAEYFSYGGLVGFEVLSRAEVADTLVYHVRYFDSLSVDSFVIPDIQLPVDSIRELGGFKKFASCVAGFNPIHGLPAFKWGEYADSTFYNFPTVRFKSIGDFMFDVVITKNVGIRFMDFTFREYTNQLPGGCGAALAYYKSDSVEWKDQAVYNWVGINEVSNESPISVYPNPVSDVLYIDSEEPISGLAVYNLSGQMVLAVQPLASEVNVSLLPAGSYTINVETPFKNVVRRRFIKI